MSVVDGVENWLMSVCVKRGIVGAVTALSAYLASHEVGKILTSYGVTIDWTAFQAAATTGSVAGLAMLHDYLKVKKGWTWL